MPGFYSFFNVLPHKNITFVELGIKYCVFIQEQYSIAKCSYMVLFMLLSFEMEDLNPAGLSFAVFSRMLCTPLGCPTHMCKVLPTDNGLH